jgi:hypothetical protein
VVDDYKVAQVKWADILLLKKNSTVGINLLFSD